MPRRRGNFKRETAADPIYSSPLVQQFVNYYASGLGDVCVVALLAVVLLVRPQGLAGLAEGAHA